jgi:hypothetical protein
VLKSFPPKRRKALGPDGSRTSLSATSTSVCRVVAPTFRKRLILCQHLSAHFVYECWKNTLSSHDFVDIDSCAENTGPTFRSQPWSNHEEVNHRTSKSLGGLETHLWRLDANPTEPLRTAEQLTAFIPSPGPRQRLQSSRRRGYLILKDLPERPGLGSQHIISS